MTTDKKTDFIQNPWAWRLMVTIAVVAGLFTLIVSVLLIANHLQLRAIDPLNNPTLLDLREQLKDNPENKSQLIEQIRAMDLLARKAYFTNQAQVRTGAWLLLGGAVVLMASLKLAKHWKPVLPAPVGKADADEYWESRAILRHLLAATGVAIVALALLSAYLTPSAMNQVAMAPESPSEVTAAPAVDTDTATPTEVPETAEPTFPTPEEVAQQWPCFRGPGNIGVATHTNVPTEWDIASGRNVRWKAAVPLQGFNSPVVWDDRVFLSGGDDTKREIYCFNADNGDLLWQKQVGPYDGSPTEPIQVTQDTGYAAPTMATDGQRAYAIFATGDIACVDNDGNEVWGKNLGVPDNHYAHSSSLITLEDLLFVQLDDNTSPRVLALNVLTGEPVWEAARDAISWSSPSIINGQLVLLDEDTVDAYDPKTGKLLWTVDCLGGEVAPSAAYGDGAIFVANEYAQATAIKFEDGQPNITWTYDMSLPDVSSPVGSDNHFYITTSFADIICLDIASGEEVWTQSFDDGFYSSPIRIGDRIHVLDTEGTMQMFGTGSEYESLGTMSMTEPTEATPAYMDGRMYVRTATNLYCIENGRN